MSKHTPLPRPLGLRGTNPSPAWLRSATKPGLSSQTRAAPVGAHTYYKREDRATTVGKDELQILVKLKGDEFLKKVETTAPYNRGQQ